MKVTSSLVKRLKEFHQLQADFNNCFNNRPLFCTKGIDLLNLNDKRRCAELYEGLAMCGAKLKNWHAFMKGNCIACEFQCEFSTRERETCLEKDIWSS